MSPRRPSDATPRRRPKWWFHRTQEAGPLRTSSNDLKRDIRALYREAHGHDPSPRQLKRWVRQQNRELPRTGVLGTGGEAA